MWAGPWENVSYVICEQHCCSLISQYNISRFYSRQDSTKLLSLRRPASVSGLVANSRRQFCRVVVHVLIASTAVGSTELIFIITSFRFTMEPRHEKTCLREFPARYDSNWPAQLQKLARVLKFRLQNLRDIVLFNQRTTKALIRLRGCPDWSAPLLFAYDIRHIFSWPGSHKKIMSTHYMSIRNHNR